ncbi:MAG: phosphatidate cytidylyltransferase [Helicobacteraceae bacterium]|jgi:phosphatidate cytidylyltransferase|nr:phosphatidate cytidylyltransferase [Helicobacteraceae bacterium]
MGFIEQIKADRKRYQTAVVLLIVIGLTGFFNNMWVIGVFLSVIYVFALHEAIGLFNLKKETLLYPIAIAIWIGALFYPRPIEMLFLALILCASVVAFNQKHDLRLALPFLYPTAPLLFLFVLYDEYGIFAYIWLLVIVIACDVGAYYAGKSMGKTPFSPSSPNKTLEGVAGGITAGTLLGALAGLPMGIGVYAVIVISLLASMASIFGDLIESYLKRLANVKDSGALLPGHGGMLDRIDGYLFAVVALLMSLRVVS